MPMEALLAAELPDGAGWQYEPKWDGFRCIAVRSGAEVQLWSKSGKPLARYFPEIAALFAGLDEREFILDGELLIVTQGAVAFDALQLRLHPADITPRHENAAKPCGPCLSITRGNTSGR